LREYGNNNDVKYDNLRVKLKRSLKGHGAKVYDFDYCRTNTSYIVSASQDGKLIVWNTFTTHKLYVIILKCMWVLTCAYCPNGQGVASAGLDNTIYFYKLADEEVPEEEPQEMKGHEQGVHKIRFLDENQLLSASGDHTVMLWDINTSTSTTQFIGHDGDVFCIDIAEDKNTFITGSLDQTAMLWDVRTGKPSLSFSGNTREINSVKYFPQNEKAFATGCEDGVVTLYDIRFDRNLMVYNHPNEAKVSSIDFSKSGKFLFTATNDMVNIWNTVSGDITDQIINEGIVSNLAVNPTGEALVASIWNGLLKVFA